MKPIYNYFFISLFSLVMNIQANAQTTGTAVCMEITNVVLISPNEFTFDVNLRNSGTTTVALRGYGGGINFTPGFENGGVISTTFLSRDSILNIIPAVTPAYFSLSHHFKFTTTNVVAGWEVTLTPMLPYRLATFKMKTTTTFNPLLGVSYDPFNPASPSTPLQLDIEPGKLICELHCMINPINSSDTTYRLIGIGNPLSTPYHLAVLSGTYNSWGNCSSVSTSIKDQTTATFTLKHNQPYSDFEIQSDKNFEKLSVRIYDIMGQIVLEKNNLNGTNFKFDFSSKPSGLYICEINEGRNKKVIKFVKN